MNWRKILQASLATLAGTGWLYSSSPRIVAGEDRPTGNPKAGEKPIHPLKCVGHEAMVGAVALSPDGKTAVSSSDDRTLRFWNTADGKEIRKVMLDFPIYALRFTPDGKHLVTTGKGLVRFWDPTSGKEVKAPFTIKEPGRGLSFSADGSRLAVDTERPAGRPGDNMWDAVLEVWDARRGRKLKDFEIKEPDGVVIPRRAAISADGSLAAAAVAVFSDRGGRSGKFPLVRVWEVDTGKEIFKSWHGGTANAIEFSPVGNQLAIGGTRAEDNGVLEVWNLQAKPKLGFRVRSDNTLFCLAFSPDAKTIVTGGTEPVIQLRDAATGELTGKLEGHTDQVHALAFSADGTLLASAGQDKFFLIWQVRPGRK